MTYDQIIANLRKKEYSPIYFLMGEEPYYIDSISDYIQKNILTEDESEFDLSILYGNDVDIRTVINAAKRYPMLSKYQVVIVKEAQAIKAWEDFSYYLQNPIKSTILVFCYKYGAPDKRYKWVKDIGKVGVLFESAKLRDYQIGAWIKEYTKSQRVSIDDKAVIMLSEYLGNDLSKIVNELDKLLITKPKEMNSITPELIEKNIGISKEFNVFELEAALIRKDVYKCNQIIRYFADNKKANPLVRVLANLFSFFSNLMIYHYLPNKTDATVASELKINPFFAKNYQQAAKNYAAWKTMNIISYIREADAKCKGIDNPSTEESEIMRELIYKILH
jgi:DNA polymerase-3 subunit delta